MAKQVNWIRQQAFQQEARDREKTRKEALGKLFHDFAKLSFAGLVIGGISPVYTELYYDTKLFYILWGVILTLILAFFGDRILK